jgi:uncharacterized membrane protein YphA (DoxX/SURF4 family)
MDIYENIKKTTMKYIQYLLMLIVSSVVLNVWFFRFNKATLYRGGGASNMVEEFAVYGLNETMVYLVGGLKILAALGLLLGFITQKTIRPSAGVMALFMAGAIGMHFKVSDPAIAYLPAALMLLSSLLILFLDKKTAASK